MKVSFANNADTQHDDKKRNGKFSLNDFFFTFFGGGMLSSDKFLKWFPFLVYIVFLGMLYITNTFIAEDISVEIVKTKKLINDYQYEYSANVMRIVEMSKRTSLGEVLAPMDILDSEEALRVFVNEYEDDIIVVEE